MRQSHVIPQFVHRGLNQPRGPAYPLLCAECEERLSVWESQFARAVFHPLVAGRVLPVKYGPWLLKFATSVCWRVLEKVRRENQPGPIEAGGCLKTWNEFLRGRRPDVGPHVLHMSRLESGRGFMPRQEAIAFEVRNDEAATWICVQMGPISLSGLIHGGPPAEWSGTRIHLGGKLKSRQP